MKNLFFVLIMLASSISEATTIIKVETTPVKANVLCHEKLMGTVPAQFLLEDGSYKCSLESILTEPVRFDLVVRGEEKIKVSLILVPGKMTDAQKKVSISRTPKRKSGQGK